MIWNAAFHTVQVGYSCFIVVLVIVQEVKLKNAGSWSSLASMAVSQTPGSSAVKKSTTAMSFELFKKAAKEKEERVNTQQYCSRFLCSGIFKQPCCKLNDVNNNSLSSILLLLFCA